MYVLSTALSETEQIAPPQFRVAGVPCVFKGCSGIYHPAGGTTGVVLCSPWGFEDLTMRKSWRLLAEAIAEAGFPCLRFDYPGTGNSLGHTTDVASADDWVASIGHAADVLRMASGARRFVFIGQSLGATLAVEAARRRSDVVGLQLIAPIVKGRAYMREMAATATIVAEKIGIKLELGPDEGLSVLGFSLSPAMIDSLKALDLTKIDQLAVADVTVFDQADRKAGAETIEHMRRLGCTTTIETIAPFHVMVSDATVIQPLPVATDAIVARLRAVDPSRPATTPSVPALQAALVGATFREDPVRFGDGGRLFGILCRPERDRSDVPAVLLMNRGLNCHIGWRRASVDQARGLAAAGIASLRFDVAGLGESQDEPDRPPNLIYSDLLIPDIRAAIDMLGERGHARIVLAGVCSGAYMALTTGHHDARVTDVIAVNPQRFVWNPTESFEDVVRYGLRSMNDYVGDIRSRGALRKLITSRHRIVPAMRFLAARNIRNMVAHVPLSWRSALMRKSMAARIHRFFAGLEENGTRVSLVYSAGDPGLLELRNYFGPNGCDLRFPNVSVAIIPDADHNLSSTRASNLLLDLMIAACREPPRETIGTAAPAVGQTREICAT